MSTTTASMNLYEKLAKLRAKVEILQKNKAGYNYTYVSEDEVLAHITAGMKQYNIDFYPRICPGTTKIEPIHYTTTKTLKNGTTCDAHVNESIVSAEMIYTWVNLDNLSEQIEVPWVLVGQQADASQAFGSGLTYCGRYFLLKFFKVATSDADPDSWRSKQKEVENMEQMAAVKEIIALVDKLGQEHMTEANKVELAKVIKSVVRKNGKPSTDFYSVNDIETAKILLAKVQEFFGLTEQKGE